MMSDDEAIEKYNKLVYKIALSYLRRYYGCVCLDDLTQEGFMGLIHAAELARLKKLPLIYTYAHAWIEQRIARYCQQNMNIVRWPTNSFRDIIMNLKEGKWGHIGEAKVAYEEIEVLARAAILRSPFFLKANNLMPELIRHIAALPERERYVLIRRFDLDHLGESTLEAIGRKLGMTRENVRQVELKAINRLRDDFLLHPNMTTRGPDPEEVFWALEKKFSIVVDKDD